MAELAIFVVAVMVLLIVTGWFWGLMKGAASL